MRAAAVSLARILHQAAQRATENTLTSLATNPFFEPGPGHKPRWPRPRRSVARVRVGAPSTMGVAMLSVASARAQSSAIIAALGAICGLVVLAGCGGNHDFSDLEAFMQEARNRQEARAEPLPPLGRSTPFAYRAHDRRSPFEPAAPVRPVERHQGTVPVMPDFHRPRQRLEHHAINRIAMVGTLSRGRARYGLVRDGDGVVHRVAVGDYLGEDHGRIRAIGSSNIDLIEIVPDGAGGWVERARTVSLNLPNEATPQTGEQGG